MKSFRFALFTLIALVIVALHTNQTYAATYAIGDVTFVGNIDNGTYVPNGDIAVTGEIYNNNPYSGGVPAYLSATTNGVTKTIVAQQTIPSGSSTGVSVNTFKAPTTPGSYSVAFSAGANIPSTQEIVDFDVNIWSYGVEGGDKPRVAATVRLSRPLSQAITLYVDDEYWDSYVNGPETVGFSVTIPAGQDGSSMVHVEYLNPSTISNTYISSNGQNTGVNGVRTDLLLGGTLLDAYGNTKLRLTGSNVNYFFQCAPQGGGRTCY